MQIESDKNSSLMVSVIVPMYNSEKTILLNINALTKQNFAHQYEIIYVDDGSTDNTIKICEEFIGNFKNSNPTMKIIKAQHQGPSKARNLGADSSKAEYLIFTDSDCIASENFISNLIESFKNPDIAAVGGTYETYNKHSKIARFIGYDIEYRHLQYKKSNYQIGFAGSYAVVFKHNEFNAVGKFPIEYPHANAEDVEICYKLTDKGKKILHNPNAIVSHFHPEFLQKFIKQIYSRAKWRIFLHKRNTKHLKGDNYASIGTLIQPFIWLIPCATSLFIFINMIFQLFPSSVLQMFLIFLSSILCSIFFIIGLNFSFSRWVYKNKKESFATNIQFTILIILRSLIWFLGSIAGTLDFIIFRKSNV